MISRLARAAFAVSFATLPWSVAARGAEEVPLLPDQPFGNQFGAYYFWEDEDGPRNSFAIYDTGASVSTRFWGDQLLDQILKEDLGIGPGPIPAEVVSGAVATGVTGGEIVGDISTPGEFSIVGLDDITFDPDTFELNFDLLSATTVPDVRLFLGTESGSPMLPSIVGMTVHKKTAERPMGTESLVDMQGFVINFSELFPEVFPVESYPPDGLIVAVPDTRFGETGTLGFTDPPGGEELLDPFRIPLELFGEPIQGSGQLTNEPNPVIPDVSVANGGTSISGLSALLDYGAQLTAMDLEMLETIVSGPADFTIDVQGASAVIPVEGWSVEGLTVPLDSNGDGVADDTLSFLDPVVFGIPNLSDLGIDVIFGMNFFNTAHQLLFSPCDPNGAALTVTFYADPTLFDLGDEESEALVLLGELGLPVGSLLPGSGMPTFELEFPESGFVKEIIDGPDRDGDGEIDRVVEVRASEASEFTVRINYDGPVPAMVVDEVPAEWEVVSCVPENSSDLAMQYPTGRARGRQPRPTRIDWHPSESGSALVCTIRLRPLNKRSFGPRKCGCLLINDGAEAVDPASGAALMDGDGNPLVTNRLFIAAMKDHNRDDEIDWSGNGDEDGDGLTDYEECELGTDPCKDDTDHDHVPDGEDADPLDRSVQ